MQPPFLSKIPGRRWRARRPFNLQSIIGDMCGDDRAILFTKSLPYAEERPWALAHSDEAHSSQKWLCHFCDTQRRLHCGLRISVL